MIKATFLFALCSVSLCLAADNKTATADPQQQFPSPFFVPPQQGAAAVVAALHQEQISTAKYSSLLIEFQITSTWLKVAQLWGASVAADVKSAPKGYNFEQMGAASKNTHGHHSLEEFYGSIGLTLPATPSEDPDKESESALLYITKLWHIRNAYRLAEAERDHYQYKLQASLIQSLAANQPVASTLLSLLYYRDVLNTMLSGLAIQKQDAWSFFVFNEIMETNSFDGVATGAFEKTLLASQLNAANVYQSEAQLELQGLFIDSYIQNLIGGASQQRAAGSSFLEESETAEPSQPNKPFFSPLFFAASNPSSFGYYAQLLKFYSKYLNVQLGQAYVTYSTIRSSGEGDANSVLAYQIVPTLQQWAQIKQTLAYLDLYILYSSNGAAVNAAQNSSPSSVFHSFVQSSTKASENAGPATA